MRMYFKSFFVMVLFLNTACSQELKTLTEQDKLLFSQMIDLFAVPVPPPPKIDSPNDTTMSKSLIDSLLNVKLKIGIDSRVNNTFKRNSYKEELVQKCSNQLNWPKEKKICYLDSVSLNSSKGHEIFLLDTLDLKTKELYSRFDIVASFTKPLYDKNMTIAYLEISLSRGTLFGTLVGVCLRKENNNWVVVDSKELSTW